MAQFQAGSEGQRTRGAKGGRSSLNPGRLETQEELTFQSEFKGQ